jgi:3-deoxy-manno-octulosonate cytidylyltransferase (CMP-KDO synthetase)
MPDGLKTMTFKVVIPARFASTRLPGKLLLDLGGKPILQWVIQNARRSRADEVVVAGDDERILQAAFDPAEPQRRLGIMTAVTHNSGTDRIAEVTQLRGWDAGTIVVNVQGDEPLLPSTLIDEVAALLQARADADIATLGTPITSIREMLDPNVVKVVTADSGDALYFSRAPIPWHRDQAPSGLLSQSCFAGARRHLGIYAYRVAALQRITRCAATSLENAEKLEQLRALQLGMRIVVATASVVPGMGVDSEHDLAQVRAAVAAG